MNFYELIKVIILGIVEGVTEWLPVSSTGHMILVDEFIKLNVSAAFLEMFLIVIQLGAIMAVVILYGRRLLPISIKDKKIVIEKGTVSLWLKIIVSCIPAAIIGILFDRQLNAFFYNYQTVAIMLILVGFIFILVENYHRGKTSKTNSLAEITFTAAFLIGLFQLVSAVFPGTSRSGATILGGLVLGISRTVAAEYTFFLAIPVMFGASALKLFKFGFNFTQAEFFTLLIGMVTAFIVSIISIRFLMSYIKKHDFKIFGYYRIILGVIVLLYFFMR